MLMLLCCCCLCFCCCWLSLFRCCCFPPFCLPPAYKSSLAASCAHFWTLSIAASSHAPHQWCPPCINIRFSHHQQSIPTIQLILRYHHCSLHNNTNALVEVTMISPKIMPWHICHIWQLAKRGGCFLRYSMLTYHNCARKFNTTYKLEPLVYAIFSDVHIIWSPMPLPTDRKVRTQGVVVSEKISSNGRMLLVI